MASCDILDDHRTPNKNSNNTQIITNRVPSEILPDEIPKARLVLRRDRLAHFQEIGLLIEKFKKDGVAFDCAVISEKERIKAHRAVLAAHSPSLNRFLYTKDDQIFVDVPADDIPQRGLDEILNYIYRGEIKVNLFNVTDVLESAQALEMTFLVEKCQQFQEVLLSTENLLNTMELAEKHGLNSLYKTAYKRVARDFYHITRVPGFLLWDVRKVLRLLESDSIIIESEVHVFTAAIRWMNHDRPAREQYFKRLMDSVRWMYMTTEEVMNCVDQETGLNKNDEVRPTLIDATWYTTLKSFDFDWKDYPIPPPRTRALRKQDPETIVNQIRESLSSRHHSFDHIWMERNPPVEQPGKIASEKYGNLRKDSARRSSYKAGQTPQSDPQTIRRLTAVVQVPTSRKDQADRSRRSSGFAKELKKSEGQERRNTFR